MTDPADTLPEALAPSLALTADQGYALRFAVSMGLLGVKRLAADIGASTTEADPRLTQLSALEQFVDQALVRATGAGLVSADDLIPTLELLDVMGVAHEAGARASAASETDALS